MKKRILIFLFILIALVVCAGLYIVQNADDLISQYQPSIEEHLSQSAGQPVKLGSLQISLFPRLQIESTGFQVGDSVSDKAPYTLRSKKLLLLPELLPLLRGKLAVRRVAFVQPDITIRSTAGAAKKNNLSTTPSKSTSKSSEIDLDLNEFSVEKGTVHFESIDNFALNDVSLNLTLGVSGGMLTVEQLDSSFLLPKDKRAAVKGRNIAFDFSSSELQAEALSIHSNDSALSFSGLYNVKQSTGTATVTSQKLNLAQAAEILKSLPGAPSLPGALSGQLGVDLKVHCAEKATPCSAEGFLSLDSVSAQIATFSFEKISGKVQLLLDNGTQKLRLIGIQLASMLAADSALLNVELDSRGEHIKGSFAGKNISFSSLAKSAPALLPYLQPYDIKGQLSPELSFSILEKKNPKVTGTVTVSGASCHLPLADSQSQAIQKAGGTVDIRWNGVEGEVATSGFTLSVPELAKSIELSGKLKIPSRKGSVEVNTSAVSLSSLAGRISQLQKLRKKLQLAGELEVSGLNLNIDGSAVTPVAGEVFVRNFSVKGITTRGALPAVTNGGGALAFTRQGKGFRLGSENLSFSISDSPKPSTLSGILNVTESGAFLGGKVKFALNSVPLKYLTTLSDSPLAAKGSFSTDLAVELQGKNIVSAHGTISMAEGQFALHPEQVLSELNGSLSLTNKKPRSVDIHADAINGKLGNEPLSLSLRGNLSEADIAFPQLSLDAFGGNIRGRLKTEIPPADRFSFTIGGDKIRIEKLLQAALPSSNLELTGDVEDFAVELTGRRDPFWKSSDGRGHLQLVNGVLHKVNLGKMLLTRLGEIPLVGSAILGRIPEEFAPYFENDDTPIQRLDTIVVFERGRIILDNISAASDVYGLQANGSIELDNTLRFSGIMIFSKEFSDALVLKVKELKYLQNASGFVRIPFGVRGRYPNLDIKPDVESTLKQGASTVIQDKLGDLLGDLMGGKERR